MTRFRRIRGDRDGLDEVRAAMADAIARLDRLKDIMQEMIGGLEPEDKPAPRPDADRTRITMPRPPLRGHIPRPKLDELALCLGETPLHARANRGLRLAGASRQETAGLFLRLDRHLRLPLDSGSNSLEIEQRLDGRWHRTGLRAVKDGWGGLEVDIARLERLAGPLSAELRQALQPHPSRNDRGNHGATDHPGHA